MLFRSPAAPAGGGASAGAGGGDGAAGGGATSLRAAVRIHARESGWIAARCSGAEGLPSGYTAAHTSPIYVAVGGPWHMFDPATARYMLTLVEGGLSYIRSTAAHYPPGTITHHHGEADHQAFLERPLHEAAAAIHRRMHELGIAH